MLIILGNRFAPSNREICNRQYTFGVSGANDRLARVPPSQTRASPSPDGTVEPHTQPTLVRVPLDQVNDAPHTGHAFEVVDEDGVAHTIPYHRVRQVWRDGDLVWSRLAPRVPKKMQKPRPARREREAQPRMRR